MRATQHNISHAQLNHLLNLTDFSQQPPWPWAQPCWGGREEGCSRNKDKSQIRNNFYSEDLCTDIKDCWWWWRSSCHLEHYKDITLPEPPTEIPSYARICRGSRHHFTRAERTRPIRRMHKRTRPIKSAPPSTKVKKKGPFKANKKEAVIEVDR